VEAVAVTDMVGLERFLQHSGAVVLVVVFLVCSIGITLLMATTGRAERERQPESNGSH
jgi:preprotein translocase subunit SecG